MSSYFKKNSVCKRSTSGPISRIPGKLWTVTER